MPSESGVSKLIALAASKETFLIGCRPARTENAPETKFSRDLQHLKIESW
jgi:hypothetical protein